PPGSRQQKTRAIPSMFGTASNSDQQAASTDPDHTQNAGPEGATKINFNPDRAWERLCENNLDYFDLSVSPDEFFP
ncbi:unnamed protein product, partial [Amoebophrya sp. A120]